MYGKRSVLIALMLTALAAPASPQIKDGLPPMKQGEDATAIVEFTYAVQAYANLHQTVAASMLPEELCADPEEQQRRVEQLAEGIRTERASARTGDLFTPAVASLLRRRLARAIGHAPPHDLARPPELETAIPEERHTIDVNGSLPWPAGHDVPPSVLTTLIPLPGELEYRLVNRDLVLLDVGANLVVDILENAVPATNHKGIESCDEPVGACVVHPDLPLCWS